ncbi:tryptophan synthase beta subunit-like PLP-dependent enzyme [Aspergillus ambiguus]|uniref:tryptophan synthase beta subunit-like PLP-dependent enzyme n=1 Tax=Aspergillus ambiguus TaxID=176160 RepID=UPI003CCDFCA2
MSLSLSLSLPEALTKLPRHPLSYPHASPIHALPTLTTTLQRPTAPQITLYAKREDHSSPLACAGNKYRKLEYLIPDILHPTPSHNTAAYPGRPTTLVTEGAIQSNHTIQVATVAQHLGLDAVAILHKGTGGGLAASSDRAAFLRTGNPHILRLLGAEVHVLEPGSTAGGARDPVKDIMDRVAASGRVPYWIPSGASLHPLGGVGYARAAFEIAAQERELFPAPAAGRFDYVFVACGSGSTVGGLIAGFKMLEKMEMAGGRKATRPPRKVIGVVISPTKPREWHEGRVLEFARRAGRLIGLEDAEREITMEDVRLDFRFVGAAYGVLDAETKDALAVMAREEGVILDPVYTAKVARGMMHWVQQGELARDYAMHDAARSGDGVNALFIHTGGQAALSAYADVD